MSTVNDHFEIRSQAPKRPLTSSVTSQQSHDRGRQGLHPKPLLIMTPTLFHTFAHLMRHMINIGSTNLLGQFPLKLDSWDRWSYNWRRVSDKRAYTDLLYVPKKKCIQCFIIFVTSDCFGIPALIKGIIGLNKNVSFSCEIWWLSRIVLNSTVTMTFHDELMIFVLLLLFYLTVGLFRQMTERQYLQNFIDDQLIQPNPAPTEVW